MNYVDGILHLLYLILSFSLLLLSPHRDDVTLCGQPRGDVLDIVLALVWDQANVVRQDQGRQDQAHLHHGNILAHTAVCARREGVERETLDGWERQFFGDPALGNVLVRLGEVLVGPVQVGQLGEQN